MDDDCYCVYCARSIVGRVQVVDDVPLHPRCANLYQIAKEQKALRLRERAMLQELPEVRSRIGGSMIGRKPNGFNHRFE